MPMWRRAPGLLICNTVSILNLLHNQAQLERTYSNGLSSSFFTPAHSANRQHIAYFCDGEDRRDNAGVPECRNSIVNLLRLIPLQGTRGIHHGPPCPLGSPLHARDFSPHLQSFLHTRDSLYGLIMPRCVEAVQRVWLS